MRASLKNDRFRLCLRVTLAAVLLLASGLAAGCGKVSYRLQPGRTLHYEYATNKGFAEDDKMAESTPARNSNELRMKVLQNIPGSGYGIQVSAHPMKGQGSGPFGADYGGFSFRMNDYGAMSNQGGMGLPPGMDINLLILKLPPGWMRRGKTWTESRTIQIIKEPIQTEYTWKYMGVETVAGRPCHHFLGTSLFNLKKEIGNPAVNMTFNLVMRLDIKTDYYISRDGHPFKCRSIESRSRKFTDAGDGEVLFDKTDYLDSEITFLRME